MQDRLNANRMSKFDHNRHWDATHTQTIILMMAAFSFFRIHIVSHTNSSLELLDLNCCRQLLKVFTNLISFHSFEVFPHTFEPKHFCSLFPPTAKLQVFITNPFIYVFEKN